ncbi:MAG: PEP-CTERM sorting domain-containing protein [Bryobacteraceae bacterium]|jgi:hypothetical protein
MLLRRKWNGLIAAATLLFSIGFVTVPVHAGTITITGTMTQDTADVGSPAVANPSLNNILDGDSYSVTLNFAGTLTGPVTDDPLVSASFSDASAGALENGFFPGSLTNVTIVQSAGFDQFTVLACLIDNSVNCESGNQLALNFQIAAASLNGTVVTASAIPSLLPLDLIEDGGNTDIQGTVTGYSYSASGGGSPVPEPATLGLVGAAILGLIAARRRGSQFGSNR